MGEGTPRRHFDIQHDREGSGNLCYRKEVFMPKAIWNGTTIAESNQGHVVEGNYYFPPQSIKREHFNPSTTHTTCPWKGEASYYDIIVGGKVNKDAAWYYPSPKEAAKQITGHVAFWKGVQVDDR
jgi:uncharacterized protein (DUF427 family)